MVEKRLNGKIAIVTGGSRGIGEAIVRLLASQGASVVVNYTSSEARANAIVQELKSQGVKAIAVQADMGSVDGAKKIVDATVKAFGKIDIIVNNAAIAEFSTLQDIKPEFFEKEYNVNVRGPLLLVKESTPYLQEYGRIINMSSVAARYGLPASSIYAGTKAAVEGMSRVWASELACKNITSNSVNPGPVDTEMSNVQDPEYIQKMTNKAVFKRVASTEEIATCVGFLASRESQWVTGDVLGANGGMLYT